MKTYIPVRSIAAILMASALLVGALSVSAQDQGGRRGRGGGFGGIPDLTDEQRTALMEMRQANGDLQAQAGEARTALNDAIYAEKVDEAVIKDKAAALAKIEAQLAVATASSFAKIRSKFNADQIEAIKRSGARGGGRGFGGGGRRGGAQQ